MRVVQSTLRHAACVGSTGAGSESLAALLNWPPAGIGMGLFHTGALLSLRAFYSASAAVPTVAAEPGHPAVGARVAVGISGGVDSAVAAMVLQHRGYDVVGVFMRNWDEAEEKDNRNCSVERDLSDAAAVCRQLGIPLHEVNFVAQYWQRVFTDFVEQCSRGLTPNPDLACNRHIKFDALLTFARGIGADTVATGHYARLQAGPSGGTLQLLKGIDPHKDQSYFLASVQREALQHVLFPLGGMTKAAVRALAAEAHLPVATKRSSAGICFIGRRNFAGFLEEYVPALPGLYVDVDSGQDLGPCHNLTAVTIGQRPGIGGLAGRSYIAGKDMVRRVAYVAQGRNHPALATHSARVHPPTWLSTPHADALLRTGHLDCQYKARYGQPAQPCTLHLLPASEHGGTAGFTPSAYCILRPEDAGVHPGSLRVTFPTAAVALTPQQAFVMYDGDLCLGSATIATPGATLHEELAGRDGGKAQGAAAAEGREA